MLSWKYLNKLCLKYNTNSNVIENETYIATKGTNMPTRKTHRLKISNQPIAKSIAGEDSKGFQ